MQANFPGNQQLQQRAGMMGGGTPGGQPAMNPQQLQQLLQMMGGSGGM